MEPIFPPFTFTEGATFYTQKEDLWETWETREDSHMDYARSNMPPTHTWQRQYVGSAAAATLLSSSQKTDRYRTIFYTTDWVTKSE